MKQIDLSGPENLFKAVYHVVLRQNFLSLSRWQAHWKDTQTKEDWKRFKETAFIHCVNDEEAEEVETMWRNHVIAIKSKAKVLFRD